MLRIRHSGFRIPRTTWQQVLTFSLLGSMMAVFAGCSSAEMRARQEQRERVMQNAKIFCEFVNGDNNPDIDVAINIAMGAKCDSSKPSSMTNYRTPSEINGIVYCCAIRDANAAPAPATSVPPVLKKPDEIKPSPMPTPTATPAPVAVEAAETKTSVKVKSEAKSSSKTEVKTKSNQIQFEGSPDLDE